MESLRPGGVRLCPFPHGGRCEGRGYMSKSPGGAVGGWPAGRRVRRVLLVGALALTPVTATLAAVSVGAPAGAAGTPVIAETFENSNVSSPTSWVTPLAPESTIKNSACLTAGTDTTQTPIPGCSSSAEDPDGSGVLQLTAKATRAGGRCPDQSQCSGQQWARRHLRHLSVRRPRRRRDRLRGGCRRPERSRRADAAR